MAKTFIAGKDLTGKAGYAVVASATDKEVELATANAVCFGILTNDGEEGKGVGVAKEGKRVLAKIGGTVSFGEKLIADSAGRLVASDETGDDNIIAEAEQDAVVNDLAYVTIVKYVK